MPANTDCPPAQDKAYISPGGLAGHAQCPAVSPSDLVQNKIRDITVITARAGEASMETSVSRVTALSWNRDPGDTCPPRSNSSSSVLSSQSSTSPST